MTPRPASPRALLSRLSLALPLALGCFVPALHAQAVEVSRTNRAISISATEQVSVLADIATVHVGYLLYGKDRDAAYSSATALSTAINKALTDSGIAPDSIESESQGLEPVQNFQAQNLSPAEAANRRFQVQQSWLVRVPANAASKALDVAVRAGANQSGQVDWSLSNENDANATAAAHALARCREVAQQLASSSGGKAGALLFASNDSETAAPRPLPVLMQRVMGASQTLAINPRRIERSVTVHAVFAIE